MDVTNEHYFVCCDLKHFCCIITHCKHQIVLLHLFFREVHSLVWCTQLLNNNTGVASSSNCGLHHCLPRRLQKNSEIIYSAPSVSEGFCLTAVCRRYINTRIIYRLVQKVIRQLSYHNFVKIQTDIFASLSLAQSAVGINVQTKTILLKHLITLLIHKTGHLRCHHTSENFEHSELMKCDKDFMDHGVGYLWPIDGTWWPENNKSSNRLFYTVYHY